MKPTFPDSFGILQEMTSEERMQKFDTDDKSLPRSG